MLSVIIPAKNEGNYIGGCLKSLSGALKYWGGDAEVIIVDNGSTDDTVKIGKENNCKIIVSIDGSIAKNRNIGALASKGNFLVFLDADCIVDEKWVSYCLENLLNDEIAITGTRAIPKLDTATWVERAWYQLMTGAPRKDYVDWIGTSNFFIKRNVFFEIGMFSDELQTGEDVDLCYRVGKSYKILLEKRIDTLHLRESKTLKELYMREFWRGSNSIKSLINSKNIKKEFMSVFIPLLNGLLIVYFIVGVIDFNINILLSLIFILSIPIVFIIKKNVTNCSFSELLKVYLIAFIFIISRTFSAYLEICKLVTRLF